MTLRTADPQVVALARAILALGSGGGERYKGLPSATPTTFYGHGNGGLLSAPGLSKTIINAMITPHLGLQSRLPSVPSNESHPLYGIMTGVTAVTGTVTGANTGGVCDDPPYTGLMKLCEHSFVFGRQSLMTRVFDIDRMGLTTNRGEFYDFQLIGNPFNGEDGHGPTVPGANLANAFRNEVAKAMFELQAGWTDKFARFLYTGNPSNNTGGGLIKEYRGLDGLINTGYRDAETEVLCPAADSIIGSFQNANISKTNSSIVQAVSSIVRRIWFEANESKLAPVDLHLVMRWSLFYELTEVWPCSFATYRCQNQFSTTQVNNIDNRDMLQLRDEMRGDWDARTGQFLIVDGRRVPVIIDDAIAETGLGNGAYQSTIYFVPLTVKGGFRSLYMEFLDYDAPNGAMDSARALAPDGFFFTTDGGRFLWHRKPPNNFCVQALVKSEPRVILRTPQLAGRLTNVAYTPSFHEREPFTDSTYFEDGGKTDRLGWGPSYYSPTSSIG